MGLQPTTPYLLPAVLQVLQLQLQPLTLSLQVLLAVLRTLRLLPRCLQLSLQPTARPPPRALQHCGHGAFLSPKGTE